MHLSFNHILPIPSQNLYTSSIPLFLYTFKLSTSALPYFF